MKNFKKIALFAGIMFALVFLASQQSPTLSLAQTEIPQDYAEDGLHVLACLQPESSHQFTSQAKNGDSFTAKIIVGQTGVVARLGAVKLTNSFFSQDLNRCETVSLLLFPFHIFW